MRKKWKISWKHVAAAGLLAIALAAGLVWADMQQNADSALSYEELLAMAEEEQAPSDVASEAKNPDESASASSEAVNAVQEEQTASSASDSINHEEELESESSVSSSAGSSSASVSSSVSSKAAHSSSSTAAETSHSASSTHSSSSSRALTPDEECDQKLAEYIQQIEQLQTSSEKALYGVIYDAYDEYMSHPVEERNLALKISVVLSKGGELTSVQSECDAQFNTIIKEMRQTLKDYGRDDTLADEAEKTYKQKKNDMIKELTDQAYSGGDGSGQSGKWLAEHAGKTE